MNIVQEWDLGPDDLSTRADGRLQLYLYHVAGLEATAIDYAVDQCFIEINDQCFLVWPDGRRALCRIRRLAAWYQRARGLGRSWEFCQLFGGCGCRTTSRGLQGSCGLG